MRVTLHGNWHRLPDFGPRLRAAVKHGMSKGIKKGAVEIQKDIKLNIARGDHAALHPFTIERKGSERPLVDHGDLLNSVSVQFVKDLVAFIGVSRGTQKDGQDLVSIAAVHEFGAVIKVTPKMRGYLRSQGLFLKNSTQAIVIPARPYIRPAWEDGKKDVERIFKKEVQDEIDGFARGL